MTSATSAQVVTLEASVRVLTVGTRQITQSVANQLDQVAIWQIEPMGRVRIRDRQFAIGRRKSNGDLALAENHYCDNMCHILDPDAMAKDEPGNWTECFCDCKGGK